MGITSTLLHHTSLVLVIIESLLPLVLAFVLSLVITGRSGSQKAAGSKGYKQLLAICLSAALWGVTIPHCFSGQVYNGSVYPLLHLALGDQPNFGSKPKSQLHHIDRLALFINKSLASQNRRLYCQHSPQVWESTGAVSWAEDLRPPCIHSHEV